MRNFSFPTLDKNEICTHLASLGAPKFSVENLISPSSDALLPVYDFLVSLYREESTQPEFQAFEMLGDHPEWYLESYGVVKSYDRLRKFMQDAGVQDFSVIHDIHRPESSRTIQFLSAAINFLLYWSQKQIYLAQLRATQNEESAKLEELHSEKFKMECEIAQIEQERAAEHTQLEELEREIKELNTQIQGLNKQQLGLQLEINNLKQEDVGILEMIPNLDFEIMQKQQQVAHLKSQLVENPQELQKTLEEKKSALAEEEALGKIAVENCEKWKAKVDVILKAEKQLLKLQTLVQTVQDQVNNRDIDKVLKERKARRKALEKEAWALDSRNEEFTWKAKRLEELSEKLSQQCSTSFKELEALKIEQEQCRIQNDELRHVLKEEEMQIEARRKESAEIVKKKKTQIAKLQDVGDRLFKAALEFKKTMTPNAELLDMMALARGYPRV